MASFLYGVLGSILGGLVLIWLLNFFSNKARWLLTSVFSRLVGADLEYVYSNKKQCEIDLKADISSTTNLLMLIPRGNELQRDIFSPIFNRRLQSANLNIRMLMPNVHISGGEYDWVTQREAELSQFDASFGQGLLKTQIQANIDFLQPHSKAGNFDIRFFNAPHTGRIVITDNFLYFGAITASTHGRDNRVYKFHRGGAMYENFSRYFEQIWAVSIKS